MTNPVWRLLHTNPSSGAWNMAVDEAILLTVAAGNAPPTLRFYGWQPHCLSLGHFQPAAEIDEAACARRGIDLVRRPSGGSAILHADELTYSLAAPEHDPHVAGDIPASYHRISLVVAKGLTDLGLPVTLAFAAPAPGISEPGEPLAGAERGSRPGPCFIRPARHEILAEGRKLVGSAQTRRGGALLQHGSIPLAGDVADIVGFLADDSRQAATASSLRAAATTVAEAAGRRLAAESLASSLADAFVACWQIHLQPAPLSETEADLAEQLLADRYANVDWTHSR